MTPSSGILPAIVVASALLSWGCSQKPTSKPPPAPTGPTIKLRELADGQRVLVVIGVPANDLAELKRWKLTDEWWPVYFPVLVVPEGKMEPSGPPVSASYVIKGDEIVFIPRYPFRAGTTYRASFSVKGVLARDGTWPGSPSDFSDIVTCFFPIARSSSPATVVKAAFPTRSTLPENLLKFYIHFSAPMGRGEAYRRVHLLDAAGKQVELPFLELYEELWNDDQTRFTLFFDPGRIKRELLPRELLGPALEAGKKYTLVIDADWRDAEGQPLKEGYKKQFQVGPADEKQPDLKTWKLTPPAAGSTQPLVVDFPESLDHALLERVLRVVDEKGKVLAGTVAVANAETRWQFTPKAPWMAGAYHLEAETILEDLAGNNLAKPFEVDLFRPIERRVETERVRVGFVVK